MTIAKDRAEAVLDELAKRYRQELEEEGLELAPEDENLNSLDDEDGGEEPPPLRVVNLAAIPMREWNNLKVSSVSKFADVNWDWSNEGSLLYTNRTKYHWDIKLGDGSSLLAEEFAPLLNLMKALLFYWTPQNALFVSIKSFNSTAGAGTGLTPLYRFSGRTWALCR